MRWLLSTALTLSEELLPFLKPVTKGSVLSTLALVAANIIPAVGVIFIGWNPFFILLIYWGESLIIGFFNVLKMLISGFITEGHFSGFGGTGALFLSAFFTVHYGMFMFVHGIFIVVFMLLTGSIENGGGTENIDPFTGAAEIFRSSISADNFFDSELSAVAALFISHLVTFYLHFIRSGIYNFTGATDYMVRPYRRIIVMHLTIIFGAFALFITGFKSAVFIIIWIGLKILADIKMQNADLKKDLLKA